MIELRGRSYTEDDLAEYFGDSSCVAGIRRFSLREGRARGCDVSEIRSGSGLVIEVNESRGMDIGRVSWRGIPISYSSYNGEVAPEYYETFADGWLRSYAGGLLVTGGLSSMGSPEVDDGEVLPLHGRISNIPAEHVSVSSSTICGDDGTSIYSVSGYVREAKALNYNLVLHREVRAHEGENRFFIEDIIENQGFSDQELMLLYHFNIGHPIVDAGSRLLAHSSTVEPRDDDARDQPEPYDSYVAPTPGYKDIVYYHDLEPRGGDLTAAIVNERSGLGIYLKYSKDELDCFTQWKFLGQGNYVAGIEPGNAYVSGRSIERERGHVKILPARSSKRVSIEVGILTSVDEISQYKRNNGFE